MLHGVRAFPALEAYALEAAVRQCNYSPMSAKAPPPARGIISGTLQLEPLVRLTAQQVVANAWVRNPHSYSGTRNGGESARASRPRPHSTRPHSPQRSWTARPLGAHSPARVSPPPRAPVRAEATYPRSVAAASQASSDPLLRPPKQVVMSENTVAFAATRPTEGAESADAAASPPAGKNMGMHDEESLPSDGAPAMRSPRDRACRGSARYGSARYGSARYASARSGARVHTARGATARGGTARGAPSKTQSHEGADTDSSTSAASPQPYQRPTVVASPYAQAPPRNIVKYHRERLAREPSAAGHAQDAPAFLPSFPGLEADSKAPTPEVVASANATEALSVLRTYGDQNSAVAESAVSTLVALVQDALYGEQLPARRPILDDPLAALKGASNHSDEDVAALGGVEFVISALKRHASVERLQAVGCNLLGLLCDREEHVRQAVDAGGLNAIIEAMRTHTDAIYVQSYGCLAIGQLASSPERSKLAADLGAIPLVLRAMQIRPERPVLQANGCFALCNLTMGERLGATTTAKAASPERCQLAVDEGGLDVLVNALVLHPVHPDVLHWSTTALMRLTHSSPSRAAAAIRSGAADALRAAGSHPKAGELDSSAVLRLEVTLQWLSMCEALESKPLKKAERVWMDMVWEQNA